MITSDPNYLQFLLILLSAIILSLPFRLIVIQYIDKTGERVKKIIPVISWIKNSGRIRVMNLFFDFVFVVLTFIIILNSQNMLIDGIKLIFIASLISLGLIDGFVYRLPNVLLITGFVITILILSLNSVTYLNHIYGAITGLIIGFGIRLLGKMYYKKEVFGMGDVKLLVLLGLFTGWIYFFPVFFVGMLIASIYSIIAILINKLNWKSEIPLGSFFCLILIIFLIIDHKYLDFLYQIN